MADLRKILESLKRIEESSLTPVGVKQGLNPQQRSAKQMPALFKMKDQGPVLGGKIKDAPSKGYFVGGESVEEGEVIPFNRSGSNKLRNREDYLDKRDTLYRMISQPNVDAETKAAIRDRLAQLDQAARLAGLIKEQGDAEGYGVSTGDAGADETPDGVSPDTKTFLEAQATEDVISTVKKKLGDYLADLSKEIKTDPDLKDKLPQEIDKISPAVKTITTDDGHEIKIHGNEDDGFRITIKNKEAKTRFDNLDEAVLACEMYCNRRRSVRETQINDDYLEER